MPKGRYVDRDFARLEHERLFTQTWQMACREEDLVGPGAFHEYTIGDQSILVVRQDDGSLRAMHNACRHRGMKIIGGAGRVEEFRCRFHGFRYALDGSVHVRASARGVRRVAPSRSGRSSRCTSTRGAAASSSTRRHDPEPLLEWLDPLPIAARPVPPRGHALPVAQARRGPGQLEDGGRRVHRGLPHPGDPSRRCCAPPRAPNPRHGPRWSTSTTHAPFAPDVHVPQPRGLEVRRSRRGRRASARVGGDAGPPRRLLEPHAVPLVVPVGSDADATRRTRGRSSWPRWRSRPGCPRSCRTSSSASSSRSRRASTTPRWTSSTFFAGNGDYHVFPTMVILVEKCSVLGYRMRPESDDPDIVHLGGVRRSSISLRVRRPTRAGRCSPTSGRPSWDRSSPRTSRTSPTSRPGCTPTASTASS